MELYPQGVENLYGASKRDFSGFAAPVTKKEISKEFLSIFLDEIFKETFAENELAGGSSRLEVMKETIMEKLVEDLAAKDTFSLEEAIDNVTHK